MHFRRSGKGINISIINTALMLLFAFLNHQRDGLILITIFFVIAATLGLIAFYLQVLAPFLKVTESEIEITLLRKRKIPLKDIVQFTENEHHNYIAQLSNETSELLQLNQLRKEDLTTVLSFLKNKGILICRRQAT